MNAFILYKYICLTVGHWITNCHRFTVFNTLFYQCEKTHKPDFSSSATKGEDVLSMSSKPVENKLEKVSTSEKEKKK